MPTLRVLIEGRPDVAGPLAQLGLARDGTYYAVAAGRCNHAGGGAWHGITAGNTSFIGIEAENTGQRDDLPWPDVQMEAYQCGVAAILRYLKLDVDCCAGHKEYALPPGRKPDPSFDMAVFRQGVAAFLNDGKAIASIPARASVAGLNLPTLRRGMRGADVRRLRAWLADDHGVDTLDVFDNVLEARVRAFQRTRVPALVADGIVGPLTWQALVDADPGIVARLREERAVPG